MQCLMLFIETDSVLMLFEAPCSCPSECLVHVYFLAEIPKLDTENIIPIFSESSVESCQDSTA